MALFDFRKSAPAEPAPAPALSTTPVPPMEDLLRLVLEEGASDLHLSVGTPPALRRHGRLLRCRESQRRRGHEGGDGQGKCAHGKRLRTY